MKSNPEIISRFSSNICHVAEIKLAPLAFQLVTRPPLYLSRQTEVLDPYNPQTCNSRYYDHWRSMTQRYCFLISLTIWLEKGILASHQTVADVLGSKDIYIPFFSQTPSRLGPHSLRHTLTHPPPLIFTLHLHTQT